jgi:hypothetical protein
MAIGVVPDLPIGPLFVTMTWHPSLAAAMAARIPAPPPPTMSISARQARSSSLICTPFSPANRFNFKKVRLPTMPSWRQAANPAGTKPGIIHYSEGKNQLSFYFFHLACKK